MSHNLFHLNSPWLMQLFFAKFSCDNCVFNYLNGTKNLSLQSWISKYNKTSIYFTNTKWMLPISSKKSGHKLLGSLQSQGSSSAPLSWKPWKYHFIIFLTNVPVTTRSWKDYSITDDYLLVPHKIHGTRYIVYWWNISKIHFDRCFSFELQNWIEKLKEWFLATHDFPALIRVTCDLDLCPRP